ncbi:MAG: VOC family protein [Rhodothermales bacterium]
MNITRWFICTLLLVNVGWAQEPEASTFTLNHIAISVENVDTSAQFYQNIFNFPEITNRSAFDGVRWFSIGPERELHLISIVEGDIQINKAVHLAFTTTAFTEFVKRLNAHNINYSDWPGTPGKINIRADGIRQVFFQDPDGYWIEVNSVAQEGE